MHHLCSALPHMCAHAKTRHHECLKQHVPLHHFSRLPCQQKHCQEAARVPGNFLPEACKGCTVVHRCMCCAAFFELPHLDSNYIALLHSSILLVSSLFGSQVVYLGALSSSLQKRPPCSINVALRQQALSN